MPAIRMHANDTYGLSLSPITAILPRIPKKPDFLLSIKPGIFGRKYEHVHIDSKTTTIML